MNKPVVEPVIVPEKKLVDRFGRSVNYVRLSVTDRCDFRCVYCMAENMTFLPKSEILSLDEIYDIAKAFVNLGVKKIRLTGGEPLVRRGIMGLVEKLGQLPGLDQLVMTTNGSQLTKYARDLQRFGIKRLNISLDSLRPDRFRNLSRTGDLQQVLNGIDHAIAAGFKRIKLNAVIMKNRNDDEVIDLVNFARERHLDLSFIEEMPLGAIAEHSREEAFVASADLREMIGKQYPLTAVDDVKGSSSSGADGLLPGAEGLSQGAEGSSPLQAASHTRDPAAGPSRYFKMDDSPTLIGFISPHSHNFCHLCNRVRVTVEGRLLLCLGNEHSVSLLQLMRERPGDTKALQECIRKAMDLKPERHFFNLEEEPHILRFMNMTGG